MAESLFAGSVLLGALYHQRSRFLSTNSEYSNALLESSHQNIILAIDLGSSSIRCSAYRYDFSPSSSGGSPRICLIQETVQQLKKKTLYNGFGDATEIFNDVNSVVNQCILTLRRMKVTKIDAVSMASLGMNFVGIDDKGTPITQVYTYASEFLEPFPADTNEDILKEHINQTGTFLHHPSYAPQHLRLLKGKDNMKFQTLSCFIFGKWTGLGHRFPVSSSEAAWMGLLDLHLNQWNESALMYAGIQSSSLPPIFSKCDKIKILSSEWISRFQWSELESSYFIPGIVDGLAANIASKCYHPSLLYQSLPSSSLSSSSPPLSAPGAAVKPDRFYVAVTIGTSAAVRIILPYNSRIINRLTSTGLWIYRINESEVIVGGALTDGGSLADWFSCFVGSNRLQEITTELEELYRNGSLFTLASSAPMTLPFWSGERSTGWNPYAKGAIHGLTHHVTPPLLLFSLMEGVMMRIQVILSNLLNALQHTSDQDNGDDSDSLGSPHIVVSGSTLENHWLWRQLLADILNKQIVQLKEDTLGGERTLFGLCEYIVERLVEGGGGGELGRKRVWRADEIESVHDPNQDSYRHLFDQRMSEMKNLYEMSK